MADTNSVNQATDVASVNSDSSDGSPAQNGTVDTQVFVRSHSIANLDHIIDDLLNGKWFDKITRFTTLYSDPSLFASMMFLVTVLFVSVWSCTRVLHKIRKLLSEPLVRVLFVCFFFWFLKQSDNHAWPLLQSLSPSVHRVTDSARDERKVVDFPVKKVTLSEEVDYFPG